MVKKLDHSFEAVQTAIGQLRFGNGSKAVALLFAAALSPDIQRQEVRNALKTLARHVRRVVSLGSKAIDLAAAGQMVAAGRHFDRAKALNAKPPRELVREYVRVSHDGRRLELVAAMSERKRLVQAGDAMLSSVYKRMYR